MADTIVGAHPEPPQASNPEVGLNCCRSHYSNITLKPSRTFLATRTRTRTRERDDGKKGPAPERNEDNTERKGIVTCHTGKKSKGNT